MSKAMFRFVSGAALAIPILFGAPHQGSAETLRMGGTGAAHALLGQLGAAYAADHPGLSIEVIPGLGSSGGLKALAEAAIDVAVSARPLKPEETAKGVEEIATGRTAFVLATNRAEPVEMKSAEVAAAFGNPDAKWPDGSPIRIVLRPESESDSKLLQDFFPGLTEALQAARSRPEVPVAATDLDNTRTAQELNGSLTAATLVQLQTEKRGLRPVKIDGVEPSLENLEAGRYPYEKTLRFVVSKTPSPEAEGFAAFLASEAAASIMRQAGMVPSPTRPTGL